MVKEEEEEGEKGGNEGGEVKRAGSEDLRRLPWLAPGLAYRHLSSALSGF